MFLKMKNNKLNSIKFINKHKVNISFMHCYIYLFFWIRGNLTSRKMYFMDPEYG